MNAGISASLVPTPISPGISNPQLNRQSFVVMDLPSRDPRSVGARSVVSGVGVPETGQPLHHVNPPERNADGAESISVLGSTSTISHLLPEIPDPR